VAKFRVCSVAVRMEKPTKVDLGIGRRQARTKKTGLFHGVSITHGKMFDTRGSFD